MRKARQLCKELLYGLVVWSILILIVLMIISKHRLAVFAGVLLGTVTAAGIIVHMYKHLDIALDMDPGHARMHTQVSAIKRLAIMAVVIAISLIYPQYVHPIGTVLGVFGVKITALMYPFLHKNLEKLGIIKSINKK